MTFFYEWKEVNRNDIEVILKHEYGHYLTWDEELNYNKDENIINKIDELVTDIKLNEACFMYYYHTIEKERRASEIMGISYEDIKSVINHQYGISDDEFIYLSNIFNDIL